MKKSNLTQARTKLIALIKRYSGNVNIDSKNTIDALNALVEDISDDILQFDAIETSRISEILISDFDIDKKKVSSLLDEFKEFYSKHIHESHEVEELNENLIINPSDCSPISIALNEQLWSVIDNWCFKNGAPNVKELTITR